MDVLQGNSDYIDFPEQHRSILPGLVVMYPADKRGGRVRIPGRADMSKP